MNRIHLITTDITKQKVDAIVNAANKSLLGGGGVDGAIHKAAGYELYEECLTLNGCEPGQAKITKGYNLPCKYIIHTVGPVWRGGGFNEEAILANAYKNSLKLAIEYNLNSIAFSNISTGVYGFPKQLAAQIALDAICNIIDNQSIIEKIQIVCFDSENYRIYESLLK
jgi:O-acetyl-ADP-ribose deacetylase (regulator of RNase III)